jgi:hypothetical protein
LVFFVLLCKATIDSEHDLARNNINHALSNGVIAIDKSVSPDYTAHIDQRNMLVSGDDYFYNLLNSKDHSQEEL